MERNITRVVGRVNRERREKQLGQKGVVIWLTGLSGSGKSTIALALEEKLFSKGKLVYTLDGDNIRHELNSDLGFTDSDREENLRRIRAVAKLFLELGNITLVSFISPFEKDREKFREELEKEGLGDRFIEGYVKCSLEECERRDVKGLYKKVRKGEIKNFTGIDSIYEKPSNPELVLDTENKTLEEILIQIEEYLKAKKFL